MSTLPENIEELRGANEELRARLEESEETLRALREGEVDAIVVGEQVFVLETAGAASSKFRGEVLAHVSEAIIGTDRSDRVIYINQAAELKYGVKASDVLGAGREEIFRVKWQSAADQKAAEEELRVSGAWRGENIHIKKDGSEFHAESTITTRNEGDPETDGLLIVVRDITQRVRSDEELRKRDERHRVFIDRSSEGIWRFELEDPIRVDLPLDKQVNLIFERARLAECNDAMAKQYGFASARELVGAKLSDLWMTDKSKDRSMLRLFIESGYDLADAETHETDASGSDRYYLNNFLGIVESGCLIRIWGTQRDVTAARQTEKDTAQLAAIVEYSDDAIISKDLNGMIKTWNKGAETVFGYTPDEAIGQSVLMLIPDEYSDEEKDILDRISKGISVEHYATRRMRKDGRIIDVSLTVSPIFDSRGRVIGASKIARDVTESMRVEQELRENQMLLSMAMKSSRMGAWEMELEGEIAHWTPDLEEIFGLRRDEFAGTRAAFFELIHEDDRERTWQAVQDALREKRDYIVEFRFYHGDGTIRWMEGRGEAVYSASGNPVRLYGIGIDITDRKRAEEALRESEDRFAKAFNSSPLAVTITSLLTTELIEVNETFTTVTGYSREEAIGHTTQELGLWNDPNDREEELQTIIREGRIRNQEYCFRTKSGAELTGLVSAELLEIGGEVCALTVIQDISDRKLLEQQLTGQNEILRAVTEGESLPEILDKAAVVVENRIKGARAAVLLSDDQGSHLFSASVRSLPDEFTAAINGTEIAEDRGGFAAAGYRRAAIVVDDMQNSPFWPAKLAGLAERHGLRACWSQPIISPSGKLLGTFSAFFEEHRSPTKQELSLLESAARSASLAIQRKQSEEALMALERRSAEEYEALLSRIVPLAEALGTARDLLTIYRALSDFVRSSMTCSAFLVSFVDPTTHIRTAAYASSDEGEVDISAFPPIELTVDGGPNSQAVFGRKSVVMDHYMDEMRGRPHIIANENGIEPNSSLAVPMAVMDRVIGTLEVQAYESNAFKREHVIALEMVANLAAVSIENVRLIETEAHARQEAEAANRMKDEFLSVLSHELRTPLNAMLGWVRMLRAGVLDEERSAKALEVIERNTRQQGSLIEDLLDVSRIISGRMRIEKERVDLHNVVQAAAETIRPFALTKGIHLDIAAEEPMLMHGDAVRLQQVITNLLQNAVKFTPSGGHVRLAMERGGQSAKIVIRDNGVGIEKEFLPHIFDRFSQADASTKRSYTGLGLGLTIVRTIVNLHGGSIRVASEGTNKGTEFTVELPLEDGYHRPHEEATDAERASNGDSELSGLTILLVDDDVENLLPLRLFLEGEKANVVCANSAKDALNELASRDFNIVISDIAMPTCDGYELMTNLRGESGGRNAKVPAIALTAYASEKDRRLALASGYQTHLAKPVDFEQLIKAIKSVRLH
jgi:PAS domain S-box-containing protein